MALGDCIREMRRAFCQHALIKSVLIVDASQKKCIQNGPRFGVQVLTYGWFLAGFLAAERKRNQNNQCSPGNMRDCRSDEFQGLNRSIRR